jgi:hypothetical protein
MTCHPLPRSEDSSEWRAIIFRRAPPAARGAQKTAIDTCTINFLCWMLSMACQPPPPPSQVHAPPISLLFPWTRQTSLALSYHHLSLKWYHSIVESTHPVDEIGSINLNDPPQDSFYCPIPILPPRHLRPLAHCNSSLDSI